MFVFVISKVVLLFIRIIMPQRREGAKEIPIKSKLQLILLTFPADLADILRFAKNHQR